MNVTFPKMAFVEGKLLGGESLERRLIDQGPTYIKYWDEGLKRVCQARIEFEYVGPLGSREAVARVMKLSSEEDIP